MQLPIYAPVFNPADLSDIRAILSGANHILDPSLLLGPELGISAGSFGASSIVTSGSRPITLTKSGVITTSLVPGAFGAAYWETTVAGSGDEYLHTYGANPPSINNATLFAAIYYTAGSSCRLVELHSSRGMFYAPLNSGTGGVRAAINLVNYTSANNFLTSGVVNVISITNVTTGGEARLEARRYTSAGVITTALLNAGGAAYGDAANFNMFQQSAGGRLFHFAAFANVPSLAVGASLTRAQELTYGTWLAEECGL